MSETENNGSDIEGKNFPNWKPMSDEEKQILDSMRASQEELDQRAKDYQKWRDEYSHLCPVCGRQFCRGDREIENEGRMIYFLACNCMLSRVQGNPVCPSCQEKNVQREE